MAVQTLFRRLQDAPVLAKGGTYQGRLVDGFAAPAVIDDTTQLVKSVSGWTDSLANWAEFLFTSARTDGVVWAYVADSMIEPASGSLYGNPGFAWFLGAYWRAVTNSGESGSPIILYRNTGLTAAGWVEQYRFTGGSDAALSVNPNNGKLELWYVTGTSPTRKLAMRDSADGLSFTTHADLISAAGWNYIDIGEPHCQFTRAGLRIVWADASTFSGARIIQRYDETAVDSLVFTPRGGVFGAAGHLGDIQMFDATTLLLDRQDGRGSCYWMWAAAGPTFAPTNDTDSSIVLAYLPEGSSAAGFRRARNPWVTPKSSPVYQ